MAYYMYYKGTFVTISILVILAIFSNFAIFIIFYNSKKKATNIWPYTGLPLVTMAQKKKPNNLCVRTFLNRTDYKKQYIRYNDPFWINLKKKKNKTKAKIRRKKT